MTIPKVLITTYHGAYLHRGGGEFEILYIENLLKKHGLIVDIYGPYSQDIESYDVILHFSVDAGGLELLRQIKRANKPIVLYPNLHYTKSTESNRLPIEEYINLVDAIIFKSLSEKKNLCKPFIITEEKIHIVPNFINENIIKAAPKELFSKLYNIENYAICMGIIEPAKNQLMAIRAMKTLGIPLVIVGKYRDKEYYDLCFKESAKENLFIDNLPYHSDVMRSALQGSIMYIELSHEPAGLSALDAGLSGCNLLLSDSEWSHEHFDSYATYANPNSLEDVKKAMENILDNKESQKAVQYSISKKILNNNANLLVDILIQTVKNKQ